ncbi:hypothetical protein [Catenuloplanes japonicus]|uniref:hypothetical protein n=1 Tax=Catenuloplanes japonicus TaxID=33876 RepID=UPI0005247DD5|nr:hypothetical protein [Catenuloplanes japonicus]
MTASSLMGLLRLAHGVLDFLVRQPEERVVAFTEGRAHLAFVSPIPHQHGADPAPVQTPTAAPAPAPGSATEPELDPQPASRPVPKPVPPRPKPGPPPAKAASAVKTVMSDEEAASIAATLRTFETEVEGLAYLDRVARKVDARKAVAAALGIEGTRSMTKDPLTTVILRHAIGARRTFAGLSSW